MSIDYNDIGKFIYTRHPEARIGTVSNFVDFLKAKLNNVEITELEYFERYSTVEEIQKFINLKNCDWFIEYLQSKDIINKNEQLTVLLEEIKTIAKQRDDVPTRSVNQLISFLTKRKMGLEDFRKLNRKKIQEMCYPAYGGKTVIEGIISILEELGITIKAESTQESKPDTEPER